MISFQPSALSKGEEVERDTCKFGYRFSYDSGMIPQYNSSIKFIFTHNRHIIYLIYLHTKFININKQTCNKIIR